MGSHCLQPPEPSSGQAMDGAGGKEKSWGEAPRMAHTVAVLPTHPHRRQGPSIPAPQRVPDPAWPGLGWGTVGLPALPGFGGGPIRTGAGRGAAGCGEPRPRQIWLPDTAWPWPGSLLGATAQRSPTHLQGGSGHTQGPPIRHPAPRVERWGHGALCLSPLLLLQPRALLQPRELLCPSPGCAAEERFTLCTGLS